MRPCIRTAAFLSDMRAPEILARYIDTYIFHVHCSQDIQWDDGQVCVPSKQIQNVHSPSSLPVGMSESMLDPYFATIVIAMAILYRLDSQLLTLVYLVDWFCTFTIEILSSFAQDVSVF